MDIEAAVAECLSRIEAGALPAPLAARLRHALAATHGPCQSLLYLQTATMSIGSDVVGMSMVIDGEVDDGPLDRSDWPYRTPLAALRDGWRVVQFPSPVAGHSQDGHVTCEFVMERWCR